MRVVITHPGLQHAHRLAAALEAAGSLALLWTGVPLQAPGEAPGLLSRVAGRLRATSVPAARRWHSPQFPAVRRIGERLLPAGPANAASHRLDHAFDAWAARRISSLCPTMVVAYENTAFETFKAARRAGAICVLDAASIHHRSMKSLSEGAVPANPDWINRRKDEEIALADHILVCSEFAAETYRQHGVAASHVTACPLGTDLPEVISPIADRSDRRRSVRFVFAGNVTRLKGVDVLIEAFSATRAAGADAELTLIGGWVDAEVVAAARATPGITLLPHAPQPELFATIASHDCLVLPSRFDGFGMVVPEAMALGVPVIVSDRVGAKMVVEDFPGAGWIVPVDATALASRMIALATDRSELAAGAQVTRRAARHYSWDAYSTRVTGILADVQRRHEGGRRHDLGLAA
ncbi:MAG: glycosyltransferase family 4 protein [Hyphomicrobiaceae bacterium]|nr:glycosyltransferase family 4 protein [Hyphomicrobiaceae bacterium]